MSRPAGQPASRPVAGRSGREGRVFTNTDFPHDPRGRDFRDGPAPSASLLALAGFVGLSLLVAAADAALTGGAHAWYLSLARPAGTPPLSALAPLWSALYALTGLAAWLVWRAGAGTLPALRLWGWQLLVTAAWVPFLFGLHRPWLALLVMPAALMLIGLTARAFWRTRPLAGWLLLPYLAWTCYASYLNAGVWWLNATG